MHRSQRDPLSADPEAPQRVLAPAEIGQRKGTSQAASQSTRAWLEEQDLGGFEVSGSSSSGVVKTEDFSDLGFGEDGYDYGQHLRSIKSDGLFMLREVLPSTWPLDRTGGDLGPAHDSRLYD